MNRSLAHRLDRIELRSPTMTGWEYRNDAYLRLSKSEQSSIDRLVAVLKSDALDSLSVNDRVVLDDFMHACGAYL